MKSLYYFPPRLKDGYPNPYSDNYRSSLEKFFIISNVSSIRPTMGVLSLFFHSFFSDIYVLNWIESVPFYKLSLIQFLLAKISLNIIKFRKRKMVWMFHNIHPHQGQNLRSEYIRNFLFQNADLIISHSKEADKYVKSHSMAKSIYVCHPIVDCDISKYNRNDHHYDIFIWGQIQPYKGIGEFLKYLKNNSLKFRINIIGKCKDEMLAKQISNYADNLVSFRNERADIEEIKRLSCDSKYVVFPYLGDCVSSSGALIDTISYGGVPVGPYKGAFKDLSEEGMCFTYKDYGELIEILKNKKTISDEQRKKFIEQNSWDNLAKVLYENI